MELKGRRQRPAWAKVLIASLIALVAMAAVVFFFWAKSPTADPSSYNTLYQTESAKAETQTDSTVVIASYNIGYLSGMTNNLPVRSTRDFYAENERRAIEAISRLNADIIGFQEIDFDSRRSYHTNQATMICDSLFGYGAFAVNWNRRYVPFPFYPPKVYFGKMLSGQAVLSKFPITKQDVHLLERIQGKPYVYRVFYLDRLAQVVMINHPLKPFLVINLHAEAFDSETHQTHSPQQPQTSGSITYFSPRSVSS